MVRSISSQYSSVTAGATMHVVELYKFSNPGMTTFTYTDSNAGLTYGGEWYKPWPVKRNKISFSSDLKVDQTEVTMAKNWGMDNAIRKDKLAGSRAQFTRVNHQYPDQDYLLMFDGEVADVTLDEINGVLRCQTLDWLNMELPMREIQVACNWKLYSFAYCGLSVTEWTVGLTAGGTLSLSGEDYDTYYSQGSPGATFSDFNNLTVSGVTADLYRSLLEFDSTDLLQTSDIMSASLQMYYNSFTALGATNRTLQAVRVTDTLWDGDTNWNNSPAWTMTDASLGVTVLGITNGSGRWMEWDVTDQVIEAFDSVGQIAHFMIFDETEGTADGGANFYSQNYSDSSLHPVLSVRYENGIVTNRSTSRNTIVSDQFIFKKDSSLAWSEYYRGGFIKATSGMNEEVHRHVVAHTSSILGTTYDTFIVLPPFPYDLEPLAGIEFAVGCDHNFTDCIDKFNNLVNYGGFPTVPNFDQIY